MNIVNIRINIVSLILTSDSPIIIENEIKEELKIIAS